MPIAVSGGGRCARLEFARQPINSELVLADGARLGRSSLVTKPMRTTLAETELAIDISVCIDSGDVDAEAFSLGPAGGLTVRPLRRLDDGSLRSGLVRIPAGWSSGTALRASVTLQLAVLSGAIALGGREIRTNGFIVVPAGASLPAIEADDEAELLLINDAPQRLDAAADGGGAIVTEDMYGIEPIVPVIDGKPLAGFERRVLWIDPDNGADTRLLRVPAGFKGKAPSYHSVNEEIFCLDGDIAPDDSRPMRAGSFLWNPANSVHGFRERSEGGCTILEWHDGLWDINFYREAAGTPQDAAQADQ